MFSTQIRKKTNRMKVSFKSFILTSVFVACSFHNIETFAQDFGDSLPDNLDTVTINDSNFVNSRQRNAPSFARPDTNNRARANNYSRNKARYNYADNRSFRTNIPGKSNKIPFGRYQSYSLQRQYDQLNRYLNNFVVEYTKNRKLADIDAGINLPSNNSNTNVEPSNDVFETLLNNKIASNNPNNNNLANKKEQNIDLALQDDPEIELIADSQDLLDDFSMPDLDAPDSLIDDDVFNAEEDLDLSDVSLSDIDNVLNLSMDSLPDLSEAEREVINETRKKLGQLNINSKDDLAKTDKNINDNRANARKPNPEKTTKLEEKKPKTNIRQKTENEKPLSVAKNSVETNNSKKPVQRTVAPSANKTKEEQTSAPKVNSKTQLNTPDKIKTPVKKISAVNNKNIPLPRIRPYEVKVKPDVEEKKPVKVANSPSSDRPSSNKPSSGRTSSGEGRNENYDRNRPNSRSNSSNSQSPYIDSNLSKGYKALLSGQYPQAISAYNSVLRIDPINEKALFGLATSYQRNNQNSFARNAYGRFIQLQPKNTQAINSFLSLVDKEPPAIALKEIKRIEKLNKEYAPIHGQIATIYAKNNYLTQAEQSYRKAVILDPYNLTYQYNLAVVYDKLGKISQSESLYRKLLIEHRNGREIPGSIVTLMERLNYLESMKRR